MRICLFEGVSVTTVILAPGACGLWLRAALLATISAASVAPAAPAAVFQTARFFAQASHLRALDPPRIGSRELGGYYELILAAENLGRAISAAEKPWAGYLGCGKTWAGYFGCG